MIAYHFTANTLRDGSPIPPIGTWLEHEGEIEPCLSGLHASKHPFDALTYAPGATLHRVELVDDVKPHGVPVDKHVGRRRKILATVDATDLLRKFARWCAAQVIDLWDAPEIVRTYIETGDESLRTAAADTAYAAYAARGVQRAKFAEMVAEAFAQSDDLLDATAETKEIEKSRES